MRDSSSLINAPRNDAALLVLESNRSTAPSHWFGRRKDSPFRNVLAGAKGWATRCVTAFGKRGNAARRGKCLRPPAGGHGGRPGLHGGKKNEQQIPRRHACGFARTHEPLLGMTLWWWYCAFVAAPVLRIDHI